MRRLLVGCRWVGSHGCRLSCVYTLLYIYIRAGGDWLPIGCGVLFRCRGCCSCPPVVGGRLCGSCRGGCRLVAIGCASCRGVGCSCRAVGCFPGCSSRCRLVVGWSGCCCPHVGRFSVVLWHPVGVSVVSDGVRCCPISAAVPVAHALRLVADWLPLLVASGRGVGCSCSPDVGRVSRSSCRDRLPLLFVVSWSGVPVALRSVAVALRGALRLTC